MATYSQQQLFEYLEQATALSEKLAKKVMELENAVKGSSDDIAVETAMRVASKLSLLQKGDKGDSPTKEELLPLITPVVDETVSAKVDEVVSEKMSTLKVSLSPKDKKEIAGMIEVPVVEKVIKEVTTIRELPTVTENIKEVAMYEDAEAIIAKINDLPTDDEDLKIDASHIKNLPKSNQVIYAGGGGGSAFGRLKVEGELDAVATNTTDSLTFVAGSNMTITTDSGSKTITFSSSGSGGGGGYQATTSGTVNGSNTVFAWASAPSVIVVDGVPKQKTQSDGTVNWTGTTTTTLSVAPNFDIFGL